MKDWTQQQCETASQVQNQLLQKISQLGIQVSFHKDVQIINLMFSKREHSW